MNGEGLSSCYYHLFIKNFRKNSVIIVKIAKRPIETV